MKTIKCQNCEIEFIAKSNHTKYCEDCRIIIRRRQMNESTKRYKEKQDKNPIDKKGNLKLKCPICGLYFQKLLSHTWQKHNIKKKGFVEMYGFDKGKSFLNETTKNNTKKGYEKGKKKNNNVLKENLIIKGEKTRFKKGENYNYKRSLETIARLKKIQFTDPTLIS